MTQEPYLFQNENILHLLQNKAIREDVSMVQLLFIRVLYG